MLSGELIQEGLALVCQNPQLFHADFKQTKSEVIFFEKDAMFQKDNPQDDTKNALFNGAVVCEQLARASIMANKQMFFFLIDSFNGYTVNTIMTFQVRVNEHEYLLTYRIQFSDPARGARFVCTLLC